MGIPRRELGEVDAGWCCGLPVAVVAPADHRLVRLDPAGMGIPRRELDEADPDWWCDLPIAVGSPADRRQVRPGSAGMVKPRRDLSELQSCRSRRGCVEGDG